MTDVSAPVDLNKPIDFSDVSGGSTLVPEDDYLFKVVNVEQKQSKVGNPMLVFKFEIQQGAFAGRSIIYRQTLTESSLWSFRLLLDALGYDTSSKVKVVPKRFLGDRVIGRVKDGEPYKGRVHSEIVQFIPVGTEQAPSVEDVSSVDIEEDEGDPMVEEL